LKNNPKQIPPANLSGKTNDARDGQSTENSISDDENNKMPKSPLNVEANSQPNDRFANMRADEETMKRIIEESEQTATAQNPNTNQPAAQEIDEKIKIEQEKKKLEEENRKILFESAKKIVKQKKTIPVNNNIKQFVQNNNLKFLILKNDDCVTNEFCESFEIQLAINSTYVITLLSEKVANVENVRNEHGGYGNDVDPNSREIIDPNFRLLKNFSDLLEDRKLNILNDEIIDYEGIHIINIKNNDHQISKILRNAINNPKMIKISQEVKVAQTQDGHEVKDWRGRIQYEDRGTKDLEFINVTSEIIQILSIVSHIRNNEPNKKFDHSDSNEYTLIGQSV
jgi:hypothetical protein